MNHKEMSAWAKDVAPVIKGYVETAIAPLVERLAKAEARIAEIEGHGIKFAGVHQRALEYSRGSVVVFDGSNWCAVRKTEAGEKPGTGDAWQLMMKGGK